VHEELASTWSSVRAELRRDVPDFKFHMWLEPLRLAGMNGGTLYVRAPEHLRTWVRDRYLLLIRQAASRAVGPNVLVEIVGEDWAPPPPSSARQSAPGHPQSHESPDPHGLRLRPKYTFEQFVIGTSNRFAHAAALAVAETPGQAYNPLFIHGRPGLGKTHLLHSIGNYVMRHGGSLRVRYSTVEEFTNEFVRAVRARDTDAFKESFRGVDVLLLDDVQFLADKARTEEELFHTFNVLHDSGRQLVMTSDRSPSELVGLEDRLGERFASGLVVALDPPELPVRRAILEKRARLDSVEASSDLLDEIAARVTTSVRALEAALIQVVAYASLRGEPPTPGLAAHLLRSLDSEPRREPCTVAAVLDATAQQFGLGVDAIVARDRRPAVAQARKVAMYLARELTAESLPAIGRGFGGRDHTTVLHAVRSVTTELARNPELALTVHSLRESLRTTH
jgi:chromosomal replication initiator protein